MHGAELWAIKSKMRDYRTVQGIFLSLVGYIIIKNEPIKKIEELYGLAPVMMPQNEEIFVTTPGMGHVTVNQMGYLTQLANATTQM
jgi:hypothetical protein